MYVIATLHEDSSFLNIAIHMDNMEISCDENGVETDVDTASSRYEAFSEAYICICRAANNLFETDCNNAAKDGQPENELEL